MGNSDSEDEFEKKASERKEAKKAKKELKRLKKKTKEQQQQQQSVLFTTSTTSTTSTNGTASNNNSKTSCSTPSSRSSNSTMNSSTDTTAQQNSPRRTSYPCVPKEIKRPRDLYWHKKRTEKETRYLPCYILHDGGEKKKIEINSSDESDSDEEEELQVVYLSFHIRGRPHHFYPNEKIKAVGLMQKRLIPFHGHRKNNYDHDDYGTLGWCEVSMQTYLQDCRGNSKFDLRLEKEYLMHVLVEARRRAGYSAIDDDIIVVDGKRNRSKGSDSFIDVDEDEGIGNGNSIDSDELEEPYTQALSNCGSDSDSDDMRGFRRFRRKRKTKCGEPIRPGDVIEYYNPIFVFGNPQGHRVATVIAVNPKCDVILKLSNTECLPDDTKVRRIKTLEKLNGNYTLLEHPGIFRQVCDFNSKKLNLPPGYEVETESDRVKKIIQKNMKKLKKNAKKSGFAPMDMINRYGKKAKDSESDSESESDSDGGEDLKDQQERDSDDDSSQALFREPTFKFKKQARQKGKAAHQLTDESSSLDSPRADSDSSTSGIQEENPSRKLFSATTVKPMTLLSLRDTQDSDNSDIDMKDTRTNISSKLRTDKKVYFASSDNDSGRDNSDIARAQMSILEKENQLALLGLSDDELPQAVFSTIKKQQQQQPKKVSTEKSPRMWKHRLEKRKLQKQYDSDNSLSFHSPVKEKGRPKIPESLSVEDSSSSESDIKKMKSRLIKKASSKGNILSIDDFSSDSEESSGPAMIRVRNPRKRLKQGSTNPIRVDLKQSENRTRNRNSSIMSNQQSSQKKTVNRQVQKSNILETLSVEESPSSESDTKKRKALLIKKGSSKGNILSIDDFSSDSEESSGPAMIRVRKPRKRLKQGSTNPIRVDLKQSENRTRNRNSSIMSNQQSSQKKTANRQVQKSCLAISFKKYN